MREHFRQLFVYVPTRISASSQREGLLWCVPCDLDPNAVKSEICFLESRCNSSVISSDMSPATVRFDPRSSAAFLSCHAHRYSSFYLRPSTKFSFQCSSDRCEKTNPSDRNFLEVRLLVDICDVEATTDNAIRRYAREGKILGRKKPFLKGLDL